jgi:hypothetical protein
MSDAFLHHFEERMDDHLKHTYPSMSFRPGHTYLRKLRRFVDIEKRPDLQKVAYNISADLYVRIVRRTLDFM